MRWIDFKIGTRLAILMGGVLMVTVGITVAGVWGTNALFGTSRQVVTQDMALATQAAEIRNLVLQARRFEKDAFINLGEPDKLKGYLAKWQQAAQQMEQALTQARQLALTAENAQALDKIAADQKAYAAGFQATVEAIRSGRIGNTQQANTDIGQAKQYTHGMEAASDAVTSRALARAAHAMEEIDAVRQRAAALQLGLAVVGIGVACGCCWAVTRSITQPIHEAVRVAEVVAAGDLRSRIGSDRRDETGQLLAALGRMNDSLVQIVGQVRQASDSIATGSQQIATGNADLSQRTESQASNLQQTASAMEQMTGTVNHNADNARQANELAAAACQAAADGGSVVGNVVTTMADISASSKKIADIIGVIDGIAFQTNILALNAAVESARAGEHGRGFAVVAAEVRALAQRSATAAREIKGLIGESVDKVEAGTRLVDQAGHSIQDIVTQVQRVSMLIGEISSTSAEQTGGIGQISTAVNQLDHMTQQNAALVEESAAAAASLNQQAARLAETVALFRL
ncbi:MAG: MCP four helix bundle domain-containing protein [Burkholderiales bacterium]|nr:MCP four helix bundle domain-containing protein [Burkholderiales bacterium]